MAFSTPKIDQNSATNNYRRAPKATARQSPGL